jgi:geranylgeranyl pyrophosphate synthase
MDTDRREPAYAELLDALQRRGDLSARGRRALESGRVPRRHSSTPVKTDADIQQLMSLIERHRSIDYARTVAARFAGKASCLLETSGISASSVHRDFLNGLVAFVVTRDR